MSSRAIWLGPSSPKVLIHNVLYIVTGTMKECKTKHNQMCCYSLLTCNITGRWGRQPLHWLKYIIFSYLRLLVCNTYSMNQINTFYSSLIQSLTNGDTNVRANIVDIGEGDSSHPDLIISSWKEGSKCAAKSNASVSSSDSDSYTHHVLLSNVALDKLTWSLILHRENVLLDRSTWELCVHIFAYEKTTAYIYP